MRARIIQYSKSANQGAPTEKLEWALEFEPKAGSLFNDKLTGWLSSSDMQSEVTLKFSNLIAAEEYAKSNNIEYEILHANKKKLVKRTYADNFK